MGITVIGLLLLILLALVYLCGLQKRRLENDERIIARLDLLINRHNKEGNDTK